MILTDENKNSLPMSRLNYHLIYEQTNQSKISDIEIERLLNEKRLKGLEPKQLSGFLNNDQRKIIKRGSIPENYIFNPDITLNEILSIAFKANSSITDIFEYLTFSEKVTLFLVFEKIKDFIELKMKETKRKVGDFNRSLSKLKTETSIVVVREHKNSLIDIFYAEEDLLNRIKRFIKFLKMHMYSELGVKELDILDTDVKDYFLASKIIRKEMLYSFKNLIKPTKEIIERKENEDLLVKLLSKVPDYL